MILLLKQPSNNDVGVFTKNIKNVILLSLVKPGNTAPPEGGHLS